MSDDKNFDKIFTTLKYLKFNKVNIIYGTKDKLCNVKMKEGKYYKYLYCMLTTTYIDLKSHIDLKKVNFFFGFNGTGKSTIGKYLSQLSLPSNEQNEDYSECANVGFDETRNEMLVFNEVFIKENFISKLIRLLSISLLS